MNNAHGTTQVTDEQIITIFHLVLQVYCSPSLKEHLHSPVMTLLACNMERTGSILRAHGVVCGCVCNVVSINVNAYLCVACACVCGCVYMCISVCIHLCQCLLNGGYKSTSILTCISNHTSTKQHSYSLAIAIFFSDTCDVTICSYNVVSI